jgi:hypothetical protein
MRDRYRVNMYYGIYTARMRRDPPASTDATKPQTKYVGRGERAYSSTSA